MAIHVRQANRGDVVILARLNRAVQDLHVKHLPDSFKPGDEAEIAHWFTAQLQNPDFRAWIAEVDGSPAGYVLAQICIKPENAFRFAVRCCEIDQLAVAPEFRRRGVARALVERVMEDARVQSIPDVELTSWSFNAEAHEAFGALGFTERVSRVGRKVSQR